MGICTSGIDQKLNESRIIIYVKEDHPLVKLANTLDWSRMKSDRTTESSGYCSMLGFNLAQLTRFLTGEAVKKAA
jgi:hypothetical protein